MLLTFTELWSLRQVSPSQFPIRTTGSLHQMVDACISSNLPDPPPALRTMQSDVCYLQTLLSASASSSPHHSGAKHLYSLVLVKEFEWSEPKRKRRMGGQCGRKTKKHRDHGRFTETKDTKSSIDAHGSNKTRGGASWNGK